jgi:SAM-dependent methyltransferase
LAAVSAPEQPADPGAVRAQLLDMLAGFLRTQALHTVARLGVADIVGERPVPIEELAAQVGAEPSALLRVMRLLAGMGVFSEAAPRAFVATPLSDGLREDRPYSVRYMAMQQGTPAYVAASEMLECVRTGEPAAERVLGLPLFEYLAEDPERSEIFNRAMAGGARASAAAALAYDWSEASVVADIGGGSGSLLSAVLDANPHLRGVVFDLPQVVEAARPAIEAAGVSDRCEIVGGDFFADALPRADVYVLARILHDWNDEKAVAILANCRRCIADGGRLRVLEQVLPEGDEPSYGRLLDLIMLVMLGGKERTAGEWRELLARGGFELVSAVPGAVTGLIEAVPR